MVRRYHGRQGRVTTFDKLTGPIPDALGQLNNLKDLDLSNNGLTGIIEALGQLDNLDTLDLSSNQLTGPIPDGTTQ